MLYDIDVEGGKCVLVISPFRRIAAVRSGMAGVYGTRFRPDRDGGKSGGPETIDFLVVSHYDLDHMGDVPLLISKFPVKIVVDHGPLETRERQPKNVIRLTLPCSRT